MSVMFDNLSVQYLVLHEDDNNLSTINRKTKASEHGNMPSISWSIIHSLFIAKDRTTVENPHEHHPKKAIGVSATRGIVFYTLHVVKIRK